jgi:hypothetical protein
MRNLRPASFLALAGLLGLAALPLARAADNQHPLRVLVVTGGHDYETNHFRQMYAALGGLTVTHATHPEAHAWLTADRAAAWDVLVLYDMWQPITSEAKADFLARLNEGKGLVVTHHAIANHQSWPEYERIIGAKYYLDPTVRDGVPKERSKWLHDVKFRVHVADANHPITRGLADFDIHDETYNLFDVHPDVTVLLTTTEATSGPKLAWAKTYGPARVVYLQLGHDHFAYENPAYRQFLGNAIRWVARRP